MFRLILTPEQHQEIAEKTYALALAYHQFGCLEEAETIRANAEWHQNQAKAARDR